MMRTNLLSILLISAGLVGAIARDGWAQMLDVDWYTMDCGPGAPGSSTGGTLSLSGTIGQPDAGILTGGSLTLTGGFWGGAVPSGIGAPAATLTAAVSRKANTAGPGRVCDLPLLPAVLSDPRQGGITELRLAFNVPPGGPGTNPVSIEQATCVAPTYAPYTGASTVGASIAGNTLVVTFSPGLENARTYKITIGAEVTALASQFLEARGLVGDVNGDGDTNALDRSVVVGAWTGSGFTCASDVSGEGSTNALDRSIVVGAWTGGQNCAP